MADCWLRRRSLFRRARSTTFNKSAVSGQEDIAIGSVMLGSGEIELLVAVAATAFVSAVLGLLISSLVSTSEQVMPLLVVSVMMQLGMCGGLIPIYGRPLLALLSWIDPSGGTRWGLPRPMFAPSCQQRHQTSCAVMTRPRGFCRCWCWRR